MREIKFLKDLPCKLVNTNKGVINLLGGDIYYDKDGNRFAFLTFDNLLSSPIFSLHLSLREYSADGKLIKDSEFFLPYMYAPKGNFVNETPIEIDKETEAVEVFVNKATFDKTNFINDSLVHFTSQDFIEKPTRAPKKKWDAAPSVITFNQPQPTQVVVENVPQNEQAQPQASENVAPVESNNEQPQDVNQIANNVEVPATYKKKPKNVLLVPMIVGIVLAIALGIVAFISIRNGVNGFNNGTLR